MRWCLVAVLFLTLAAPASGELVFSSPAGCMEAGGCRTDVWRVGDDGSSTRRIVENGSAPAFDLLGTRVAYVSSGGLWVADPDGSDARRLTNAPANAGYDTNPAFSPSGALLAFDSNRPSGGPCRRIWTVDPAGSGAEPQPLAGSVCGDRLPRFTPDGLRVIALRYDQFGMGTPSVVSIPLAGGPASVVVATATPVGPFTLAFSPDGRMLALETRGGLTTLDLASGALEVRDPRGGEATWSPIGPALFYARRADDGRTDAIHRLDVGTPGAQPVAITEATMAVMTPSWGALGASLPELPLTDVLAPVIAMLPSPPSVPLPMARAATGRAATRPRRVTTSELASLSVVDPSGVRRLSASIAREVRGGRCRTVTGRRIARTRRPCRARSFRTVTPSGLIRSLERLREGTYRVWLRASDNAGNDTTRPSLIRVAT